MCMSRKERIENGEDGFPQEPVRKRFLVSDVTPEGMRVQTQYGATATPFEDVATADEKGGAR